MSEVKTWWKEGVIYQIYPRSFYDTNGDGVGDLRGIIEKLDYLASLNVDIIWLNPIFASPNDDNGYDISDYYRVMDEFGSMEDFDELLKGVHQRGMRLILDIVPNHTSDEHAWFVESRSSTDNPKRDWYIWRKPKADGSPPTNWRTWFSESAWKWDEKTQEYYLHLFSTKQPDLNWEKQEVRQAVFDAMKFWLDKGIDGFRIDVANLMSKPEVFEDYDLSDFNAMVDTYANGPRIHEFMREMNQDVLSKYDMMTVGEGPGIDLSNALDYVGYDRKELHMIYQFGHLNLDFGRGGRLDPKAWTMPEFKKVFDEWNAAIKGKGWITYSLDNHDFPRMVSRFGNDQEYRIPSAKQLIAIVASQPGTPCFYFGTEIGMTNIKMEKVEDFDDVEIKNAWKEWKAAGKDEQTFIELNNKMGRDNVRTPFQWDASEHGGFTEGTPWIKVNPRKDEINLEQAEADPNSILHFFRYFLKIRKEHPTWIYGDYKPLTPKNASLYVYERSDEHGSYLFVHQMGSQTEQYVLPPDWKEAEVVINNYEQIQKNGLNLELKPWQSIAFKKK